MRRALLVLFCAGALGLASLASGQTLFVASLDGSQETPPDTTIGTGTAWAILSADMSTLTYSVTYATLSSSFLASHFHVGAPGVAGGVVHALSYTGNTSTGTWTGFPDSILTNLFAGNLYVNVHSSKHQGGEIRGQFRLARGIGFTAALMGLQETPPNGTAATGTGWAVLDSSASRVTYAVTISRLDSTLTGGHFHVGAVGVAGPVVHPISFIDSTATGVWRGIPDSIVASFMKGNVYLNAHTARNPGGALRGQLLKVGPTVFTAGLDGSQETPPDTSKAQGTGWGVLSADLQNFSYSLTYAELSAAFRGSHIHIGAPGVGGPVVLPITSYRGNTATGSMSGAPPDSVLIALVRGNTYMNVHSGNYPGGEIRGQLNVVEGLGFYTTMTASQETPPTSSGALGTGWAILDTTGDELIYRVTVAGLDTTLSGGHFHDSPPGVGGPVVHAISFTDSTSSGTWTAVPANEIVDLLKGDLYFNVHTPVNPGGAIRGQLGDTLSALTAVAQTGTGIPASFALSQNYPNPFNPSTLINYQLSTGSVVTLRVYDILGREVATLVNGYQPAGSYIARFDGAHLASGVYFYRLGAGNLTQTKKMVLLK